MKHFMDIVRVKENSEDGMVAANTGAFEVGDRVVLQTKIDGANAHIEWEDGELKAFSRKNELNMNNNLRGFWEFVQTLDKEKFRDLGNRCLYGEWLCLSGDTLIRKTSAGKKMFNYITLKEMYEFLHSSTNDQWHFCPYNGNTSVLYFLKDKNNQTFDELLSLYKQHNNVKTMKYESSLRRIITYNSKRNYIIENNGIYSLTELGRKETEEYLTRNNWWNRYGMPRIFSLFHNQDVILPNQVKNIFYTGKKEVYEVVTRLGNRIKATINHPFYTPYGYKELKELKVNDCVAVTDFRNNQPVRRLGKGSNKIKLEQQAYKNKIGKCEKCGITSGLELHHKDRNYKNNDPSNWLVLCSACHKNEHRNDFNFSGHCYSYIFDNIVSIKHVGLEDCYDIEMSGDDNCANFIANNFIVHNCKHTIPYDKDAYNKWYVYDMFDKDTEQWLPQEVVKEYAESHDLIYVHTYYDGPFISWEHVKSFFNQPMYGDRLEGIVAKNMTKLNDPDCRNPFYLKVINDSFKEIQLNNHVKKVLDPNDEIDKAEAEECAAQVVTEARVRKEINKLIDEGILPETINPQDMSVVARNLPKRIYDDVIKEESELIGNCVSNKYFGKAVGSQAMNWAKKIILGA